MTRLLSLVLLSAAASSCGGLVEAGPLLTPSPLSNDSDASGVLAAPDAGVLGDSASSSDADADAGTVCQTVTCRGVCCDPAVPIGGRAVCVDRDPPEYGCCVLVGDSGQCLSPVGDAGSSGSSADSGGCTEGFDNSSGAPLPACAPGFGLELTCSPNILPGSQVSVTCLNRGLDGRGQVRWCCR
jgi:hypothetical protein